MCLTVGSCLLGQESAYVWPVDGDPAKIQTGVKRLYRKGEEMFYLLITRLFGGGKEQKRTSTSYLHFMQFNICNFRQFVISSP